MAKQRRQKPVELPAVAAQRYQEAPVPEAVQNPTLVATTVQSERTFTLEQVDLAFPATVHGAAACGAAARRAAAHRAAAHRAAARRPAARRPAARRPASLGSASLGGAAATAFTAFSAATEHAPAIHDAVALCSAGALSRNVAIIESAIGQCNAESPWPV